MFIVYQIPINACVRNFDEEWKNIKLLRIVDILEFNHKNQLQRFKSAFGM